ncbi:MAG: hypothetical protein QM763_09990 [Agriterribacter sp.]
MKPKKQIKPAKLKLPKGFSIDNTLNGKYDNQLFFKEKAERANRILKTVGLPEL